VAFLEDKIPKGSSSPDNQICKELTDKKFWRRAQLLCRHNVYGFHFTGSCIIVYRKRDSPEEPETPSGGGGGVLVLLKKFSEG
jgi:hypothetical protein